MSSVEPVSSSVGPTVSVSAAAAARATPSAAATTALTASHAAAEEASDNEEMANEEDDEQVHDSYWVPDGADDGENKQEETVNAPDQVDAADGEVTLDESNYNDNAAAAAGDDTYADADDLIELDDSTPAVCGDLTATFFSELSAAQDSAARAKKRRRHGPSHDADVDSDDDSGLHQRRAFHIPSHLLAKYDPTCIPQTAEEYLLHVRFEAEACPTITRSTIDSKQFQYRQTPYMPHLSKAMRPKNDACLPKHDWTLKFAQQFAEARQSLACFGARNTYLRGKRQDMPRKNDWNTWIKYCLGDDMSAANDSESQDGSSSGSPAVAASSAAAPPVRANCPSLALVVSLDQVETKGLLIALLEYGSQQVSKLKKVVKSSSLTESNIAATATSAAAFPNHPYALWIYTLLLRIDKPLSDEVAGEMRRCYRQLCWLRADSNDPSSDVVKYCNLILTLCDQFGQKVEME